MIAKFLTRCYLKSHYKKFSNDISISLELTKENDNIYSSDVFRNYNKNSIYGGAMLCQSIMAGYHTVNKTMNLHSFQVYFLSKADPKKKVSYHVDSVMNGKSFVKRSVTAIQNEVTLSKSVLSFKTEEPPSQFIYTPKCPSVINHNKCPLFMDVINQQPNSIKEVIYKKWLGISDWFYDFPMDIRPVNADILCFLKVNTSNKVVNWLKLRNKNLLNLEKRSVRHEILGYFSDFSNLLPICTMRCLDSIGMISSLDHVMWFHCNKFDPTQWLLFESECTISNNGTTLNSGRIWSESGVLLATIMQEGIIRPPKVQTVL